MIDDLFKNLFGDTMKAWKHAWNEDPRTGDLALKLAAVTFISASIVLFVIFLFVVGAKLVAWIAMGGIINAGIALIAVVSFAFIFMHVSIYVIRKNDGEFK